MKNIFDILKKNGLDIADEIKPAIEEALNENYRTIAEVEKIESKRDFYKEQLETTEKAMKEFEGIDVKGLQKQISDLQIDLKSKETGYQNKLSDMEFQSVLDGAVSKMGAKNSKAVKALLDLETLKTSNNQSEDIKTALSALKTENDFLFNSDEPIKSPVKDTGSFVAFNDSMSTLRAAMGLNAEKNN